MMRPLVPVLLILIAVISLGSLFYVTVPKEITSTYSVQSVFTAINPELILDYSTSTVSCTGTKPVCFDIVFPYTFTQTWSGQTTQVVLSLSTSTSFSRYAASGFRGVIVTVLVLMLLFAGIALFARDLRRSHP